MVIKGHSKARILDENIDGSNYATLKKCQVLNDGKVFRFMFACEAIYDVSIEYLLNWFSKPTYTIKPRRTPPVDHLKTDPNYTKELRVIRYRRTANNTAVRVYLNNGDVYIVVWDTVLMACEIEYEWFGGWTKEAIEATREWFNKNRNDIPFQVINEILDERLRYL